MDFVALTTVAEVGAALAGFATLAAALRSSSADGEAIYGVVVNSVLALVFSLLALRFENSESAIRLLAGLMFVAAAIVLWRGWGQAVSGARDQSSAALRDDVPGSALGIGAALCMLLAPVFAALVVIGREPPALYYELALMSFLLDAALLMLFVVWRNIAAKHSPPAA